MRTILFFIVTIVFSASKSQTVINESYTFSDTPLKYVLTDYEKSKPLIELKDKRIFELVSEKDGEFEYVLTPSVIQVNSDSEIDKNLSAAGFHSTYTVNRKILDILIYEYYYKTNLPITAYNDFKNVIKAAADFNKGKIILTKK